MTAEHVRRFLVGREHPSATLEFLDRTLLPVTVRDLNQFTYQRRIALYPGDLLPTNERNLTDVRTRMGQLIEYLFSTVGNDFLATHGISDLAWTNVVAHRFPDLEVRDGLGQRGIRIEIKCLQSLAEEKAANFDTLKKDLHPQTDYVVVFIWEWSNEPTIGGWDSAPRILKAFAFHACSLAHLRDYHWLQNPPRSVSGGFQGFDLRYPLNCTSGSYNVEEGNLGKLMRIWKRDIEPPPRVDDLLQQTIETFVDFEEYAVWKGFSAIAKTRLSRLEHSENRPILVGSRVVGYHAGDIAVLFRRRADTKQQREITVRYKLQRLVVMNDKYGWTNYRVVSGKLQKTGSGKKPKHLHLGRIEN